MNDIYIYSTILCRLIRNPFLTLLSNCTSVIFRPLCYSHLYRCLFLILPLLIYFPRNISLSLLFYTYHIPDIFSDAYECEEEEEENIKKVFLSRYFCFKVSCQCFFIYSFIYSTLLFSLENQCLYGFSSFNILE